MRNIESQIHPNETATPIRPKLWQVLQNLLRIAATAGFPAFVMWQAGLFELTEKPIPQWIWVVIGAFIGGFISTPANNIGNLIWEILTTRLSIRNIKIDDQEGPRILREVKRERRIRELEAASVIKLTILNWKRCSLLTACLVIPIYGLIVLLTLLNESGFALPLVMLGSAAMAWAAITTGLALAIAIWIKSFFHEK